MFSDEGFTYFTIFLYSTELLLFLGILSLSIDDRKYIYYKNLIHFMGKLLSYKILCHFE